MVKSFGFLQNSNEPCIYKKHDGKVVCFLILYVDDILLIKNDVAVYFQYERSRGGKLYPRDKAYLRSKAKDNEIISR